MSFREVLVQDVVAYGSPTNLSSAAGAKKTALSHLSHMVTWRRLAVLSHTLQQLGIPADMPLSSSASVALILAPECQS